MFAVATLFMVIHAKHYINKGKYDNAKIEWKAVIPTVQTYEADMAEADAIRAEVDAEQIRMQTDIDISKSAEVHVVSIYDSKVYNLYAWYTPDCKTMTYVKCYEKNSKKPVKEVTISLAHKKKKIVLVLVAYQPINWTLKHDKGTVINKIILGGCCEQHITGITGETRESFSHNPYNTVDASIEQNIEKFTNQWISSYQENYSATTFYIK